MRTLQHKAAWLMGLVLLFLLALGARRAVLEAQYRKLGDDLPFTLESALHYRRVKMIYDTGQLPPRDFMVQYPEGVPNRTSYNLGSEYVYAAAAHLFPESMPFANRLRWLESGWFCLGIPLLALWLRVWRRNGWAAGVGAAFYAVALSSVMRSTGQELSRENFALPILIAHLLADAVGARSSRRWTRGAWSFLSASLLALALASWDLVQYFIMLRMAWVAIRTIQGRTSLADPVFQAWCWQLAALLMVGAVHPYYRSHGWLLSPAMLMGYATLGLAVLRARGRGAWLKWSTGSQRSAGTWLGCFVMGSVIGHWTAYGSAYSHFGALLWAKLRYLNVKPPDPALLNFDQRIMWVPALHSATPALLHLLFPFILYLTIPGILLLLWSIRKRSDQKVGELLFFFGASFIAFWFFARFHVYLSLFASALVGVWAGTVTEYRGWRRGLAAALLGLGLAGEGLHTLQRPERWGRINVYYKELDELADWLRREVAPEPVLANFGASAFIAAYGKCAVLLHPKFEDRWVRQRVLEYGEQLFKGTEASFRDWADDQGARYYVYAMGEFAHESPELQMRYFVNALNPAPSVPARLFEAGRRDLRYFHYCWSNHKYVVYRILTREDEARAGKALEEARHRFQTGDLAGAQLAGEEALRLDPGLLAAAEILGHIASLKEAGFEHQPTGN